MISDGNILSTVTAALGAITSLAVLFKVLRKVESVHVLVNGRLGDALNRLNEVTKVAEASGVQLPPDSSTNPEVLPPKESP